MSKAMSTYHLMELLEEGVLNMEVAKMIDASEKIIDAAEECHGEMLGDALRPLFGQWLVDSVFFPNPPETSALRGIFPTLVLCCCNDNGFDDIDWMYIGHNEKRNRWNTDLSETSWSPNVAILTKIMLAEGLRVASYTTDMEGQYPAVCDRLQQASKEIFFEGPTQKIIHELFRQAGKWDIGCRAAFLLGQLPILQHFCVGSQELRPQCLFYT